MQIGSTTRRTPWRSWLISAAALVHWPAMAMAVVEDTTTLTSYGSLIFGIGALSAILTHSAHHELLKAYAPNLDALFKWFLRIGVTLIALELILDRFGIWVDTRQPGEILLGIWSFGRMGLACYVSGIARHISDRKSP